MKRTALLHLFLSVVALAAFLLPVNAPAASGDLYVTDSSTGTIFQFTPSGIKSTFASGLDRPSELAFDRAGNLFVAETGSGTIYKFTPAGVKSVFASVAIPAALAFDGAGNLFVSDICSSGIGCGSIFKFTPAGMKTTFAHGQDFDSLAFDGSGDLLAADFGNNEAGGIYQFSRDGTESLFAGVGGVTGMAFDNLGHLFASNFTQGLIFEFTAPNHGFLFSSNAGEAPNGLAFDGVGNLFEADSGSGSIFKFAPNATRTTFASGVGRPFGLAFEPITEKLRNISARGLVGTGENVLIGGFLAGGNALANNAVIIRAIGPSLSRDGITNPLSDPMLELHNASSAVIATNDNWQDTQATQIRASHLAPTDPHEAAIYTTLPAGAYTAIVRGVSSATGVAVVEVYSLAQ